MTRMSSIPLASPPNLFPANAHAEQSLAYEEKAVASFIEVGR
jgi:hypothetical protein